MSTAKQEPLLTVREVGQHVRVTDDTVQRWIKQGRLKAIRLGSSGRAGYRIAQRDLDAFLKRHQLTTTAT